MNKLFIVPSKLRLSKVVFDAMLNEQLEHMRKTLASKGDEYAPGNDDRMHNFNVAMAIDQAVSGNPKTREDVIWDMAKKHFVSVMDARADIALEQTSKLTKAYLDEKFGDLINYMFLMKTSMMQTLGLLHQVVPTLNDTDDTYKRMAEMSSKGHINIEPTPAMSELLPGRVILSEHVVSVAALKELLNLDDLDGIFANRSREVSPTGPYHISVIELTKNNKSLGRYEEKYLNGLGITFTNK